MILSKRMLLKWRKEALTEVNEPTPKGQVHINLNLVMYIELNTRILKMTRILLDIEMMKGGIK